MNQLILFTPRSKYLRLALAVAGLYAISAPTPAATLRWDPNGDVAGTSDGAGTWDTSTALWQLDSNDDGTLNTPEANVLWDNSQGYNAVFGNNSTLPANGYTIDVSTDISVRNLTFNTGNSGSDGTKKYVLSGAGTLTFADGGKILIPAQGGTGGATIGVLIANALNSTLTVSNSTGSQSTGILQFGLSNPGILGKIVIGNTGGFIVQQSTEGAFGSASDIMIKDDNTLRFSVTNGVYNYAHFTLNGTGQGNRGAFYISGASTINSNVTLASSTMLRIDANVTFSGNFDDADSVIGNTLEYRGLTNNVTVTATGTNSYSGGTVINAGTAGKSITFRASSDAIFGKLPDVANTNIIFKSTGTTGTTVLRSDASFTIAATRNISLQSGTSHTFNTNGNDLTVAGIVSGSVPIFKTGAGVLLLTGNNDYSGLTTVTTGSIGGHGSSASALTLSGGTRLTPGASGTAGTFFATGLDWNSTAGMDFQLGTTSDLLQLSGSFNEVLEGGNYTFAFTNAGGLTTGLYTLVNFATTTFEAGSDFAFTTTVPGLNGNFVLNATNLQFQVTAVPEPQVMGLAAFSLLALLKRRRR